MKRSVVSGVLLRIFAGCTGLALFVIAIGCSCERKNNQGPVGATETNTSAKSGDSSLKVLVVDGDPRWEYRYLKNVLISDKPDSVCVACLLLSADSDFPQEANFDADPATPERDGLKTFPGSLEALLQFDVIVFGDVNPLDLRCANMSAEEIMKNIVSFVEEHGGGIAFIAGPRNSPEKLRGTPLEKLLPVNLKEQETEPPKGDVPVFHPILTNEGKFHALTSLEEDREKNFELWMDLDKKDDGLPGFYWWFPSGEPKSGAIVLANHPMDSVTQTEKPIFVLGTCGRGKTFFSAVDSTWRWRWPKASYFGKFWRQVLNELRRQPGK